MNFLRDNRFFQFLIFLTSLFTITPFIANPVFADFFATVIYSLILLAGLYAFSDVHNFLKFTTVFFLFAIFIDWIDFFYPEVTLIRTIRPLITASVLDPFADLHPQEYPAGR